MFARLLQAAIWFDRWSNQNLLRGRFETVSGRSYRKAAQGCRVCTWLCAELEKIEPGHCRNAYLNDRVRDPTLPRI
jgi:hypothetical protein